MLKKKGFWMLVIVIAVVVGLVAFFSKSRVDMLMASDENMETHAMEPADRKIVFSKGAEEPFKEGREFLKEKKLDEALGAFQKAAKLSPETAVIHYWVGMTYFYQREPENAIVQFKKVLELEPENYRAHTMIGKSLLADKTQLDQAVEYFDKALSINPDYMDARFELARIYALKGDMKRSLAEFGIIFRSEPNYAMYHFELGRIFESQKAVDQAKNEYQRALQLNPGLTPAKEALDKLK
jgi:tetratricopeptide (TPR) repeat protein